MLLSAPLRPSSLGNYSTHFEFFFQFHPSSSFDLLAFSLVAISDQSFKKNFFIGTMIAFEMHGQVDIDSNSEVKREFLIVREKNRECWCFRNKTYIYFFNISKRFSDSVVDSRIRNGLELLKFPNIFFKKLEFRFR